MNALIVHYADGKTARYEDVSTEDAERVKDTLAGQYTYAAFVVFVAYVEEMQMRMIVREPIESIREVEFIE